MTEISSLPPTQNVSPFDLTDSGQRTQSPKWFQNYGWIYAGVVSFTFSTLILLATLCIWSVSILALKDYQSEKCLVTLPAAYSGPSTVRKCVSGYIPIGQGIFLTVFSIVNFVIGMILSFNPNRKHLWANLILNLVNITTVGCLCLFDFMFSQLDAKHLWLNEHAYEIMYLYKYEGIMATILLLIHFISLWLTLMSLLQPCDDNCIKKNCDSTNSHASTPSHIKEFNATNIEDTPI